ncbi:DUF6731 family protein [Natroniella sp. ANB-PHB2]|uniref:DUF6731 family protein n=1 Tax=Natroniella sp. ANB-PHB2 TaxID=3384444 RepID=UPI0038D36DD2
MAYRKEIKCEYYRVNFRKRNWSESTRDGLFDLRKWIAKANKKLKNSFKKVKRNHYDEFVRIDKIDLLNNISEGIDKKIYVLNFVKMREKNLPSKVKEEEIAQPLVLEKDESIGEHVTALYDPEYNILMVQRNAHSLTPTGISNYLNELWGKKDKETIHLTPIFYKEIFEKIKKAQTYRSLTLRLTDFSNTEYQNGNNILGKMVKNFGGFEAVNVEINLTMGHNFKRGLNKNHIHNTLAVAEANEDVVKKTVVGMKESEDTNVEHLDLFEEKIHDIIPMKLERKESIDFKELSVFMYNKYENRVDEILENMQR